MSIACLVLEDPRKSFTTLRVTCRLRHLGQTNEDLPFQKGQCCLPLWLQLQCGDFSLDCDLQHVRHGPLGVKGWGKADCEGRLHGSCVNCHPQSTAWNQLVHAWSSWVSRGIGWKACAYGTRGEMVAWGKTAAGGQQQQQSGEQWKKEGRKKQGGVKSLLVGCTQEQSKGGTKGCKSSRGWRRVTA